MPSEDSNGDRIDFDVLLANQLISQEEDIENVNDSNTGQFSNGVVGTNQIMSGSADRLNDNNPYQFDQFYLLKDPV